MNRAIMRYRQKDLNESKNKSTMHPHGAFSAFSEARRQQKTPGAEALGVLVREAGLEPARPEWTLEPESSESTNSTTRPYARRLSTTCL